MFILRKNGEKDQQLQLVIACFSRIFYVTWRLHDGKSSK